MDAPHLITERFEYDYCRSRGHEPLLNVVHFQMAIGLRVEVQREIFGHSVFGRGDIPAANQRFYHWVWEHKQHYCEECMQPLQGYSATFVSHILTRGAHPEMAHDPRNINILCFKHHEQWDTGNRKAMRIYPGNVERIKQLKQDYNSL